MNELPENAPDDVVYRYLRTTISTLVTSAAEDIGDRTVPACPEWTVRDLLAHLADIAALVTRRLGGEPDTDAESAAQHGSVRVVLDAWAVLGEQVASLIAGGGGHLMIMDALSHELDLHRILGTAPERGHPAFRNSLDVVVRGMGEHLAKHDVPALEVRAAGQRWSLGDGAPAATVTGADYDILRSFTGRRSSDQIRALDWSADPAPWIPAFTWAAFQPPAAPTEPMAGEDGLPRQWR
ncbi:maleylpyruvate isomerase N-terminal domain-containing protein [Amycolatopsis sp. NPDC059021]|uniref:maleylpyruvate isomerase N-terminal domain-containing protein n=1 Tax=Amycolatopsis sp. NPDC059021 TaxID=3346704 RepID=UPI0036716912